ncbi:efflux RND transporter periplasmic adaptor subunit [Fusobacterium gonidiaformans]|uniref:efflux RND transporter periplasmic adaptor subunit n=1 Tax=Fusobacterium gonidiaformans TaxID=849 RepID=UPI0001BC67B8|nr:efflux RND transporter periplasmic adaptor subunit [Fusobacterium gonidiaformans]EFS29121.2 efflux transporter, RND family, MFP subunit [Fusobacterium gonidiaformans ATCC 25563]
MNKKWICIFMISFLLIACEKNEEKEKIRPVKIQEIGVNLSQEILSEYPSSIQAKQEAMLSFQVPGKIEKILVSLGDRVKKGQVLAKLEEQDYHLNLEANAQKYEASKAVAENAGLQFERVKTLYQNNAIPKKDYDMALAQYKSAIAAEKANQAGLSHAANEVYYGDLIAPYDGIVSKKMTEAGMVVAAGTPILSISSEDVSELTIQVPAKELEKIKEAQRYYFIVEEDKSKTYPLTLKTISFTPDMTKSTYPIVFQLERDNIKNLYAGMSGTVVVALKKEENSKILLPISAIFEENGSFVYLYGKENKAEKREVKLGDLQGNGEIQIISGLKTGDKVIIAGVSSIHEGQVIKALPPTTDTNVGNLL